MFQEVEGDVAIVVENGVYKQCPLYTRNGFLFAKIGAGFVRLMTDGSTSKAKMRLETLSTELALGMDGLGRLMNAKINGAKPLMPAVATRLLDKPAEEVS